MSRFRIFLAVVFVLMTGVVAARRHQAQVPELLTACPQEYPECVLMYFDIPSYDRLLRSDELIDSSEVQVHRVTVALRARSEGGPSQALNVAFTTPRGAAIRCSPFERPVAVVGFSANKEPIVLTSTGPLIIEGRGMVVGCECARVLARDSSHPELFLLTPALDLWAMGYRPERLSYDEVGNLYVDKGTACVRLSREEEFAVVPPEYCGPMELLGYLDLGGFDLVYRAPDAERIMILQASPCFD